MSDNLPTVWPAERHTIAKHKILKEYLSAWIPILSNQYRHGARFVDGFAGPGIYREGEPGSPILAIDAAVLHEKDLPVPVRFTFIEDDADRHQVLCAQIRARYPDPHQRNAVIEQPRLGDCEMELGAMLNCTPNSFGPALVFLDQFGYSAVPVTLIAKVMSHRSCEVLSYLAWKELDRFITDPNKHAGIGRAFGTEDWRPAITMDGPQRRKFLLDLYTRQLSTAGGAKYVWPFAMLDDRNRLLYWLFFATNNLAGLREMKRAMAKVDQTGSFSFSDRDAEDQMALLSSFGSDQLAEHMAKKLTGRQMTVAEINEYVLTQTPCYLFKEALGQMEREGSARVVSAPPRRKQGHFNDDSIVVSFERVSLFAGL